MKKPTRDSRFPKLVSLKKAHARWELGDPNASSSEATECYFAMRATRNTIAPLMIANNAGRLRQTPKALLTSQSWLKLRLDRELHLADRPIGVFPP